MYCGTVSVEYHLHSLLIYYLIYSTNYGDVIVLNVI